MRKKKWFVGTMATVAVVLSGVLGIGSVKSVEADAAEGKSPQEEFVYEQLGRDDYTNCGSNYYGRLMLCDEEKKNYAIINSDGSTYFIDNSDGKYGYISIKINSNHILSQKDGKYGLMDKNGNVLLDGNYHETILPVSNDITKVVAIDGSKALVYDAEDLSKKAEINYSGNIKYLKKILGYYIINNSIYDEKGTDINSKFVREGCTVSDISALGDKYLTVKYWSGSKYIYVYFDKDLKSVSDKEIQKYQEYLSVNSSSASDVSTSGKGFNFKYMGGSSLKTDDGYALDYVGTLKGYKLYCGYIYGEHYEKEFAIFDENKNLVIKNLANQYTCIGDKIVIKEKNSEDTTVYKIFKVSLKSELGIADIVKNEDGSLEAEVSAKDIDKDDIKDSDGNTVKYDDLDEDAKAVIEQKFDFTIKAGNGVVPDNSHMSISKVVAGKEYNAAKEVTKSVATRMAVFNIDLLNADNVKVQPSGKLEITTDIPTGFDTDRIAVYRLSEDGQSYTKLESKVVDGKVVFETDHFSTYMIVEEIAEAAVEAEAPDSGDSNNIFVLIAIMMLAVLTGVVAFERKRA